MPIMQAFLVCPFNTIATDLSKTVCYGFIVMVPFLGIKYAQNNCLSYLVIDMTIRAEFVESVVQE